MLTKEQADEIREDARADYDLATQIDVAKDAEVEEVEDGYWVTCRLFLPKN